jgi:pyrimidine-specific ribonucleoside hydrolase
MDFYLIGAKYFGLNGCALHDLCAVAYLSHPMLFSGNEVRIQVGLYGENRGKTFICHENSPAVLAPERVNNTALAELMLESIQKLAKKAR